MFYPEEYLKYIGEAMIVTLERVYRVLASGSTSSVGFLSQVLAKFSLIGYGSMLFFFLAALWTKDRIMSEHLLNFRFVVVAIAVSFPKQIDRQFLMESNL